MASVNEASFDWLKRTTGVDDWYIAQWPMEAWAEWERAMHAPADGPCPAVPGWMQPLLGRWHEQFSLPFPSVAQQWPSTVDWFAQADEHDDLTLMQDRDGPTVDELREAFRLAQERSATPALSATIVPTQPWGEHVAAELEAFYIVGSERVVSGLVDKLDVLLGWPSRPRPVMPFDYASLCPDVADPRVRGWEWMYG
ncbi:hypothetical protein A9Z40_01820 [Microbacterium arborescens]|uniref:Uncharacterized protein n=1 Tax=Microbacterium arborescens TaxID=33883 RepID=A0ABX2WJ42_9MICO|nr:hypothetical protein [Microbacterium arborescens]OAZ41439.1 hypothetical protein A9Z40_01820 [Microbacterium arborescens]